MADVLVLGGAGRTGSGVAGVLARNHLNPVLVGRDSGTLEVVARDLGCRTIVVSGPEEMVAVVQRVRATVIVNTVGPFIRTAKPLVDACLEAGSHYVDLANDVGALLALLRRGHDAERAGRAVVTAAGFGATATESVVARLCDGRRQARRIRVDAIPSLEQQEGKLGEALAGTLVEGQPCVPGGGRYEARRYTDGILAAARVGAAPLALVTPDGDQVTTALMPLGDLVTAQRSGRASFVDAASSEAPTGALVRTLLPVATTLLALGPLRDRAARRLAAARTAARPAPRAHSWGHAHVTWQDGKATQGWLRLPEAQATTAAIAAETARRLAGGDGRPGAWTPVSLFGPDMVTSVGGEYLDLEDVHQ